MQINKLTEHFAVSPQLRLEDLVAIKQAGFQSILCNRPDGEDEDQVSFAEFEQAASKLSINIRYQPVISGNINQQDVDQFSLILTELPGPTLAYCRTGTRCTILWSLAKANSMPSEEIIRLAQKAGYTLSPDIFDAVR